MCDSSIKISDIPILNSVHCKIKKPENVERIINELIDGGPRKLQVVSDFDFTITKQKLENGDPVLTSFGILNACKSLPPDYLKESNRLYEIYRPLEIDPSIPVVDKVQHMIEWWKLSGELLKGFPFEKDEIDEVARRFKNALRDGTHEMFQDLNTLNVPLLVFSAGLGDSVISVLNHAKVNLPNVKVVSNFLQFKDGLVNGLQDDMIHTYNKNETVLKGSEYYELVHDRDHVIVLGDSLGDAGMADGVPKTSHILKIGFLFDHIEKNLPLYMETFDIVLLDDQTMDVPRGIIDLIKSKSA